MKSKRLLCLVFALLLTFSAFPEYVSRAIQKTEVEAATGIMVAKADTAGNFKTQISDLSGKRVGVLTGTVQAIMLPEIIPEANFVEFNSLTDLSVALLNNKIDAFGTDDSMYKSMLWENQPFTCIDEPIGGSDYGAIFGKGKNIELRNEFNAYIKEAKGDGTFDALLKKWFGSSEPVEFASYKELNGTKGKIKVGICSTSKPFVYKKNDIFAGFEIDILVDFCEKYGYTIAFEDTAFSGIIAGVAAEKYDMGISAITITDERKESVDFSDVIHRDNLVVVIKKAEAAPTTVERLSDLSGKKIGLVTGALSSVKLPKLVPDAKYIEFNTSVDAKMALDSGKVDAFPADASTCIAMKWEGQAVERVKEPIIESDYGIVFTKDKHQQLRSQVNEYIAKIKADGTHAALEAKWFADNEPTEFLRYDDLSGENGTIKVGISTSSKPYAYVKNGKYTGFDIEFMTSFAREYGYNIIFEDTMFASVLAGVSNGIYDIGASGFTITEERKESVDFSEVYHSEDIVLIVKNDTVADDSLKQFENATLGVVTGSLYGEYSREQFPDATIKEFNNFADVHVALKQNKVSGIMLDRPNFNSVARTDSSLRATVVPAYTVDVGFGFQKNEGGNALREQMNELLEKLDAAGETEKLIEKWYGSTEPKENIPFEELSANEVTLNAVVDTTRKPFAYMYKGKPVGFEAEVLYRFCKEYGYNVKISDVSFASGLAGLAGEKYDIVCGGLYMTDERKESVNFSRPYMNAEVVMATCERSGFDNFLASIKESFEKTFVREQRWKLIVEGIATTMIISIFAVLGGTLLGFALYMLSRSKNKWLSAIASGISKVYSTIIAGTPTLVVLMLLFYVVFTSPDMSGVVVAIVGFILTFGSFVNDNLALTVSGVDNGQLEAAYALGYSRNKTFFRIILPQAMKMFVPSYAGEIVSLVKATSVVGYIAVNDLTKMGDIIRGNTYEAFFPLIAVALIYFAITWIIAGLLSILKKKTEPKRRKNKNILKGVVR